MIFKGKKIGSMVLAISIITLLSACTSSNTTTSSNGNNKQPKFPTKPITIIVPFSAGGSADLTARILTANAKEHLGEVLIIENLPGGGGMVGQNKGAKATADGYTLSLGTTSITTNPILSEAPFATSDFKGVIQVTEETDFLVVQSGKEYKNFKEFIEYAKKTQGKLDLVVLVKEQLMI